MKMEICHFSFIIRVLSDIFEFFQIYITDLVRQRIHFPILLIWSMKRLNRTVPLVKGTSHALQTSRFCHFKDLLLGFNSKTCLCFNSTDLQALDAQGTVVYTCFLSWNRTCRIKASFRLTLFGSNTKMFQCRHDICLIHEKSMYYCINQMCKCAIANWTMHK